MLKLFHRSGPCTRIIVFLGNPGPRYAGTRHNVGFMTADVCEKETGCSITRNRFRSLTEEIVIGNEKVLLMKPQTLMNLSGEAVGQAAKFYKIPAENILVISDDISLPVGKVRVRAKGSAGGHNGLKNIIAHLGTDAFPRVKVGVGEKPYPQMDLADWVLSTFKNEDAEIMVSAVQKAWEAAEMCITDGVDKAMSKYN